jgi:hypothetical protein
MRPLSLHLSALSSNEYNLFTQALQELAALNDSGAPFVEDNNAYYEQPVIGVREIRAWLRGRYHDLSLSKVDLVNQPMHTLPILP